MSGRGPDRVTLAQPFTFGGIAALAHAPLLRLLAFQALTAALVTGAIITGLVIAWKPVIFQAISTLPDEIRIENGVLIPDGPDSIEALGSNRFLSLSIDTRRYPRFSKTADLQVQLRTRSIAALSLLGFLAIPYPPGLDLRLNKTEVRAWWSTWQLALLVGSTLAVFCLLLFTWGVMAFVNGFPVAMIAFYLDRPLGGLARWKLAAAALLPASLIFGGAIIFYSLGQIRMVELALIWCLHLLIGWVYSGISPFFLARRMSKGASAKKGKPANPFRD